MPKTMVDRDQNKGIQGFGARVSDLGKRKEEGKKKMEEMNSKSRFLSCCPVIPARAEEFPLERTCSQHRLQNFE